MAQVLEEGREAMVYAFEHGNSYNGRLDRDRPLARVRLLRPSSRPNWAEQTEDAVQPWHVMVIEWLGEWRDYRPADVNAKWRDMIQFVSHRDVVSAQLEEDEMHSKMVQDRLRDQFRQEEETRFIGFLESRLKAGFDQMREAAVALGEFGIVTDLDEIAEYHSELRD